MTLRTRVTLAAGFAVLLTVVATSVAVYLVVRGNLHDQIDQSLRHDSPASTTQSHRLARDSSAVPHGLPLVQDVFGQLVDGDGEVTAMFDNRPLPVTAEVLAVARGERAEVFFDAEIDGRPVRVYATSAGPGAALEVGRSLGEVEQALQRLVLKIGRAHV